MYEADLLPLSGVQHVIYCPRQAALIHVEQAWQENVATAEGRIVHAQVDQLEEQNSRGIRIAHAMVLRSDRLKLFGRADIVELHDDPLVPCGIRPFPVEVKRGAKKHFLADKVQLCAQAFCLEEFFGIELREGSLFYNASHRRVSVLFDDELRAATIDAASAFHEIVRSGVLPHAQYNPKRCDSCSLESYCQPRHPGGATHARNYLEELMRL